LVLDGFFSTGVEADFGLLSSNAVRRVADRRQPLLAGSRRRPGGLNLLGDGGQAALLFNKGPLAHERCAGAGRFGRRIGDLCPSRLLEQMSHPDTGELNEHLISGVMRPRMLQLGGAAGLVG
jgi:hypothetical protein